MTVQTITIKTKFFGEIPCNEEELLFFQDGIPGFSEYKRYVIITTEDNPYLKYLQSAEEQYLCLPLIPPQVITATYDIELHADIIKLLDLKSPQDTAVYLVLNIPEDPNAMTVNLKAPIIINAANSRGAQGILYDTQYSVKQPLFDYGDSISGDLYNYQ